MPIPVTDLISTTDPSDVYATHDSSMGKGGYREVTNIAGRDAITVERRTAGMAVYITDDSQLWILDSNLTTWTLFSPSSIPVSIEISLEAGEDMTEGTPVYVSGNKLYKADNVINASVLGILKADVSMTFLGIAVVSGLVTLSSLSLTPDIPYYLGNGTIDNIPPSSGRIVKIGTSLSSTLFLVAIKLDVLLA